MRVMNRVRDFTVPPEAHTVCRLRSVFHAAVALKHGGMECQNTLSNV
jgi:hypothetical protein